jgi:hypothetical protein
MGSFQRGAFGALVLWVKLGGKAILGVGRHAGRSFHPKHRSTKGAGALRPSLGALRERELRCQVRIRYVPGTYLAGRWRWQCAHAPKQYWRHQMNVGQ